MKQLLSYLLVLFAFFMFSYTFFFSDTGKQVTSLEHQLEMQERERRKIEGRVGELRTVLVGIQTDPDALEKVAREELRLMAENEELVLFEKR